MKRLMQRNIGVAGAALLASSATLLCCVLPAALVALGAGAALIGLIAAVPQLVWLSEHKALVFGIAGTLLFLSGVLLWRARTLPCPTDPDAARACTRLRAASHWIYGVAAIIFVVGALFAFVLPALQT